MKFSHSQKFVKPHVARCSEKLAILTPVAVLLSSVSGNLKKKKPRQEKLEIIEQKCHKLERNSLTNTNNNTRNLGKTET